VFTKVASPQFLVWLVPLVALVRGRAGRTTCALLAGACALTQLVYPARYAELVAGDTFPATLLLLRNALLIAVAAVLTIALVRRSGSGAPGRVPVSARGLPG
jgi:hypothetical protein